MYSRGLASSGLPREVRLPPEYSGSAFRARPSERPPETVTEHKPAPPATPAMPTQPSQPVARPKEPVEPPTEMPAERAAAFDDMQPVAAPPVAVPPLTAQPAVTSPEAGSAGETPEAVAASALPASGGGLLDGIRQWFSGGRNGGRENRFSGEDLLLLGILLVLFREERERDAADDGRPDDLFWLLAALLFIS